MDFVWQRSYEKEIPYSLKPYPEQTLLDVVEVVASHPAVSEVGIRGVPDQYQGEAVKAWIVLRPGQRATADEIRAFCREKLTGYKVPKQIEFVQSLPKSIIGKVLRRALAEEKRIERKPVTWERRDEVQKSP